MTKRKGIYVYGGGECWLLAPSDTSELFHVDVYGDNYKNKKDHWELVEDVK